MGGSWMMSADGEVESSETDPEAAEEGEEGEEKKEPVELGLGKGKRRLEAFFCCNAKP